MRGRTIRIQMDVDLSAMPGANFTLHRLMLAEFDGHSHPVGSEKSLGMERGAERAAGGTVVGGEVGAASVGGEREGGGGGRDGDDGDGDGDGKVAQEDSGGMGAGEELGGAEGAGVAGGRQAGRTWREMVPAMCTNGTPIPNKPHIVVVMADDLGFGDLGYMGSSIIQTPFIDQLARSAVHLSNFFAPTWCAPSRCICPFECLSGRAVWAGVAVSRVTLLGPWLLGIAVSRVTLLGPWRVRWLRSVWDEQVNCTE